RKRRQYRLCFDIAGSSSDSARCCILLTVPASMARSLALCRSRALARMIHQPDAVYTYGDEGPEQGYDEDLDRESRPKAQAKHPSTDVTPAGNQAKPTIKGSQFIQLFATPDLSQIIQQVIEEVTDHQAAPDPPQLWLVRTGH